MRGYIAWLSTKFALLLFAVMLFVAFMLFFKMQDEYTAFDKQARDTHSLARIIDSVCASPFTMQTTWRVDAQKITLNKNGNDYYVTLQKDGRLTSVAVNCVLTSAGSVTVHDPMTITGDRNGVSVS